VQVLLEMTRLETVERNDLISLSALVEEVFCDLDTVAKERKVTLIQASGEAEVTGNDTLVYRAVYNLVENAIKYNRSGGFVTVDCQQKRGQAVVTVIDTGFGIPVKEWKSIFEPFFRSDKSRSRSMGGAGLGLALVSRIAEAHGGTVGVVRSSAFGTEMELNLPQNG